jgi:hypothetical protein
MATTQHLPVPAVLLVCLLVACESNNDGQQELDCSTPSTLPCSASADTALVFFLQVYNSDMAPVREQCSVLLDTFVVPLDSFFIGSNLQIYWNGLDSSGDTVPSGTYYGKVTKYLAASDSFTAYCGTFSLGEPGGNHLSPW